MWSCVNFRSRAAPLTRLRGRYCCGVSDEDGIATFVRKSVENSETWHRIISGELDIKT